jgi:hypothetical protein
LNARHLHAGGDGVTHRIRGALPSGGRLVIDQTEALAVEEAARRTVDAPTGAAPRVRAILSLADDGGTLIKGVEIDGRRIETRW